MNRSRAAETTFAEVLEKAGYATAFVGEWHMCESLSRKVPPDVLPERNGFDEVCVITAGMPAYRNAPLYRGGGRVEKVADYPTDLIGSVAVNFVDRRRHPDMVQQLDAAYRAWRRDAA